MTYLQRVIVHQEQLEHQMTMYAVGQKLTENEERCAELCRDQIGSMMQFGNVSLEELRDDVSRQISAQQLQQQARDDVLLGKMMDLADSTTQSARSLMAKYEQIQSGVSESIRVSNGIGQALTHLHSELLEVYQQAIVNNITRLVEAARAETEKRSEETSEAITVALENISTQLSEIEDKSEDIAGKVAEIPSNVTQSQQQLFSEVAKEMDRKMNESLISSKQSHAELVANITDTSNEIQIHRTHNERELLNNNMTKMLAEIEGTCSSLASSVNAAEELLSEELQQQRRIASANAQLLTAVNQTCVTAAETSLQQQNNVVSARPPIVTDTIPLCGK